MAGEVIGGFFSFFASLIACVHCFVGFNDIFLIACGSSELSISVGKLYFEFKMSACKKKL